MGTSPFPKALPPISDRPLLKGFAVFLLTNLLVSRLHVDAILDIELPSHSITCPRINYGPIIKSSLSFKFKSGLETILKLFLCGLTETNTFKEHLFIFLVK